MEFPPLQSTNGLVCCGLQKAEILNTHYGSIFTVNDPSINRTINSAPYPAMSSLTVDDTGVLKLLKGLDANKARGPNEIPA